MFSSQAQSAYLTLQSMAMSAKDNYTLNRAERALDEILRNPGNAKPAGHQVRSAWANAGKVLDNRRRIVPQLSLDTPGLQVAEADGAYDTVDILDWLDHAAVSASDRNVLRSLAGGADAEALADDAGVPVQRLRERISRARRVGHADYQSSVVAA
ncbi:hypothetical protein A5634_19720 [Mycobacterium asiaticum]|uniref:Uncharacterized protein n=1 Tax=Mycobacterium asiaticum TaxID=1790 RepID=A0A1A3P5C2_MYCAS|nr:hypothetical protein [Mycobacterium asiaticum]OBK28870.1 hypothetical protein A5634_19720 [Mycobacterium asiaticum]